MQTGSKTLIGIFSDVSAAKRATDELRALGVSQVRLVENDQDVSFTGTAERQGASSVDSYDGDSGAKKTGIGAFFARLFGFDDEKDRSTWSLNRDSEAYFQGAYDRKHHLVVIEDSSDSTVCREVITRFGGEVEEQGIHYYDSERYRDRDLTASLSDSRLPREDSTVASADMHSVDSLSSRPRIEDDSPLSSPRFRTSDQSLSDSRVQNEDRLFQASRTDAGFMSDDERSMRKDNDNLFSSPTAEDRNFGASPQIRSEFAADSREPEIRRDPSDRQDIRLPAHDGFVHIDRKVMPLDAKEDGQEEDEVDAEGRKRIRPLHSDRRSDSLLPGV